MKKVIQKLYSEVQDALNESEPHDYYERLERIESLVKKLRAESEDIMILSQTAYNKGFSDAMSGDNFKSPYSTKDERHADYSFGFTIGLKEYEE
tara:strand:+ start:141 stop:422 length:282 start_codon:yes stop_codon:yes gene_type:complete